MTNTEGASNFSPEFGYGGFWRRFAANFLDTIILGLITSSVSYTINATNSAGTTTIQSGLPAFLIGLFYVLFFWVKQEGQTLGKRVLGVRVVKEDGGPIDLTTGILRYIGYFISSILLLGYISAAFNKRKQTWHDKIAKTVVIKTSNRSYAGWVILSIIIPILGLIGLFIAMAAGIFLLKNTKNLDNEVIKKLNQVAPTQTLSEVKDLQTEVFDQVNLARTENKLKNITVDKTLCAYSQRRLEQLQAFGKYDDSKGFIEDLSDSQMSRTYFPKYQQAYEQLYELTNLTEADDVVANWKTANTSIVSNAKATHGCVRSDGKFLVYISAN